MDLEQALKELSSANWQVRLKAVPVTLLPEAQLDDMTLDLLKAKFAEVRRPDHSQAESINKTIGL